MVSTEHKWGDKEYCVRLRGKHYEVAVFSDKAEPDNVYHVIGDRCNCPAAKYRCKHWAIVQSWIAHGKPWLRCFNENGDMI